MVITADHFTWNIYMTKHVLVTGATKGIGLAISEILIADGYQVIGIARNLLDSFPGKLYICDLSDVESTKSTLNEIKLGYNVTHIVNNVGISLPQPLGEIDLDSLNTVLDLNVRTAVQITQAFLECMQINQYGRIINITSRAIFGVRSRSSYAAAKSALLGLTKTWALELAPYNITVNSIAPGPIETELFRKTRPVGSESEKSVIASIPLGRIGKPEEIAAAVKFLLSEEAGFITGHNLCVDGGGSL